MSEVCVGITDDLSDMEDTMRMPEWQQIGFRVYFELGQDIVCESRDELSLVLEGYQVPEGKNPKPTLFGIRLYRKLPDRQVLMWYGHAINTNVQGPPRLKWVTR